MKHIIDETYKGHELVYLETEHRTFAVDIRIDDFDGEFIGAYTDLLTISDCRLKATGFIDGYHARKECNHE